MQRALVGRGIDDVVLGDRRVDRFGEGRAQLGPGQLEGPAAQGVTVMVDGLDVLPQLDQRTDVASSHGGGTS